MGYSTLNREHLVYKDQDLLEQPLEHPRILLEPSILLWCSSFSNECETTQHELWKKPLVSQDIGQTPPQFMHTRVHKVYSCTSITWGQGRSFHYIPTDFKLLQAACNPISFNWSQLLFLKAYNWFLLVSSSFNWSQLLFLKACYWFLIVPTSCNSFNLCLRPFLYLLNFDFDHHLKQENNSRTKLMFLIFTDSSRPTWEPA